MKRLKLQLPILFVLMLSQCNTVPLTGRRQLSLINDNQMMTMSFSQYDQVLAESRLSTNTTEVNRIKTIGNRIKVAVESYLAAEGMSEVVEGFEWEFNLIESDQLNAWCMPGGKVAFYTGILPVCQTDEGIAVVMGHEVAHAIARHGSERMSHALTTQLGGVALDAALANEPQQTRSLAFMAFGLGSQFGAILPFSRLHETEADGLGLYFMAMAGYNPEEAPKFWERMSANSAGSPPEFLSTHPNHQTRINDLNELMPKAKEYYNQSTSKP